MGPQVVLDTKNGSAYISKDGTKYGATMEAKLTHEEVRQAILTRLTVPVPIAGKALNVSRNAAYEAAKRGEIPTIRIGSRLEVPTAPLRRMLGIADPAAEVRR